MSKLRNFGRLALQAGCKIVQLRFLPLKTSVLKLCNRLLIGSVSGDQGHMLIVEAYSKMALFPKVGY